MSLIIVFWLFLYNVDSINLLFILNFNFNCIVKLVSCKVMIVKVFMFIELGENYFLVVY